MSNLKIHTILIANEDTWIATPPSEARNDAESVIASRAKQSKISNPPYT